MRRIDRGPCPVDFATKGAAELVAARTHFSVNNLTDGFDFVAYSNKAVKAALGMASSFKCAYCEADYDGTQPVDVEHYRPKGAVDTENGRLIPGYWWLAARWENLLPSCIRCNRAETLRLYDGSTVKSGKANLFPLFDEKSRATQEGSEAKEIPLLINPCDEDPAAYIRFMDKDGDCIAIPLDPDPHSLSARKARASIDIYGLNRAGLVRDRSRYMQRAQTMLARLQRFVLRLDKLPVGAGSELVEIVEEINIELDQLDRLICGEDRFTGMLVGLVMPKLAELSLVA